MIALLFILFYVSASAQATFTASPAPFSDPEINNWGRGAVYWNGTAWDNSQAPTIPDGSRTGKNSFWRFNWSDLEDNNGNYIFYGTWPRLDHYVRQTIDRGEMLHFGGVMPICSACGDHVTSTYADGARMYFPKYIYDSMQRSSFPAWNTGTGLWMPNWNNPYYLSRYEALLKAVANYFNTGSYVAQSGPWVGKRVYYKDLLDAVGINGYGDFGEWHNWPYDGNIPASATATSASLKRIIDANIAAFPNTQLVTMMASFYNGGSARVPLDVTYHVLTAKNNFGLIGWRRDNIGDFGYGDWLEKNPNSYNGMRFDTAIVNRYKYAIVTGEPLNGSGSCCPYYKDIRRQTNLYHYSAWGNGNYGSRTQEVWDTIRSVIKITGYRYSITGGTISALTPNAPFFINLDFANVGVAPIYQKRWRLVYELSNAAYSQSFVSRFNPYLFLPGSVTIKDTFILSLPAGNYMLKVKFVDTAGVLSPIILAQKSPAKNSDGSYTLANNLSAFAALPVKLEAFNAVRKRYYIELTWKGVADSYIVQSSSDGREFTSIHQTQANFYNDFALANFYRLALIGEQGSVTYSKIIYTGAGSSPMVYTIGGSVIINFPGPVPVSARVYYPDGRLITQKRFTGNTTIQLPPGIYLLVIGEQNVYKVRCN